MDNKIFINSEIQGPYVANINALWQETYYSKLGEKIIDSKRFPYIEGYKEGAHLLLKKSIGNPHKDFYIYPIVFMYRQYLELMLKNFYFLYEEDENKRKDFIKNVGHSLEKIFEKCKPLIESYYLEYKLTNAKSLLKFDREISDIYIEGKNPDKVISIDEMESFIKEFNDEDPKSFIFRYDFNKDLTKTIVSSKSIELRELYMMIERIDECFFVTYNGM